MQTKSITRAIRAKITEWIESINDTALREDIKKDVLISGGSITSMYLGEPVNDFDVYLTNRQTLLSLVRYYVKPFSESITIFDGEKSDMLIDIYRGSFSISDFLSHPGHRASALRNLRPEQIKLYIGAGGFKPELKINESKNVSEPFKYQPAYFSPNAISLTDQIQIVIRFCGTAEEIHKTFDFVHATNYFTFAKGVVINLPAIESILTKQLHYQGSFYPLTSIIRAKKFVKRGFNINAGEMLKMMFQLSLLDLTNFDVLEEQLIGIDVAYFELLIEALRAQAEREPDFKITPEFFNMLIDKIFNESEEEN